MTMIDDSIMMSQNTWGGHPNVTNITIFRASFNKEWPKIRSQWVFFRASFYNITNNLREKTAHCECFSGLALTKWKKDKKSLTVSLFSFNKMKKKKDKKSAHGECWLRQSRLRLLVALKRNLHSNSTTQPAETSSSSKISFSSSTISSSSPTISLSSSRILLSSLTLKQHIQILMLFLEIFDWNKNV